jgi:hypothetical protein
MILPADATHPAVHRILTWLMLSVGVAVAAPVDSTLQAQSGGASQAQTARPWYERYSLRGYAQLRYNRLLESNPDLTCSACDRSIGNNNGFFLRRARLVLSGDPTDRTSITIEVDYGTETAGQQNTLQLRTGIFEVFLDAGRVHRLRFGQAKLPFGFETLQSSSQRLALDRSDPVNSGVPNERDLGIYYLWSPPRARALFRAIADSGLKGTGDYGVLNTGIYNGQSANRAELNNNLHAVMRLAWPFRFANGQFVEVGVQGYHGRFVVPVRSLGVTGPFDFEDERAAVSLVVYPQPLGLQGEWNAGVGPEFDPVTGSIRRQNLQGGYVQAMYRTRFRGQQVIPFARYQSYDGGKKLELDARAHRVRETEFGVEWVPRSALELTVQYTISDRRTADGLALDNRQRGELLRLQGQISY